MPWPQAVLATRPMAASPASTAEALRIATLQASWARDRRVAGRRLAWRWLLWAWWRYLLPAALVLGSAAWLAMWLMPQAHRQLSRTFSAPTTVTRAPPPADRPTPTNPDPLLTAEGEPIDIGLADAGPMTLRLDRRWAAPRSAASTARDNKLSPADDTQPAPTLTPDNWLHSKEP